MLLCNSMVNNYEHVGTASYPNHNIPGQASAYWALCTYFRQAWLTALLDSAVGWESEQFTTDTSTDIQSPGNRRSVSRAMTAETNTWSVSTKERCQTGISNRRSPEYQSDWASCPGCPSAVLLQSHRLWYHSFVKHIFVIPIVSSPSLKALFRTKTPAAVRRRQLCSKLFNTRILFSRTKWSIKIQPVVRLRCRKIAWNLERERENIEMWYKKIESVFFKNRNRFAISPIWICDITYSVLYQ